MSFQRNVLVVRAVVFELEGVGEFRGSSSEDLFGERRVWVHLRVGRIAKLGLLVQRPPEQLTEAVWEPTIVIEGIGAPLCRFHEDSSGEPLYCPRGAVTRDGYCEEHARSWRALYERCAQGDERACAEVASTAGEMFAVYALDYGGPRLKVGLTQLRRFAWRVAEQPHAAAALVATGPLAEMRDLERELGGRRTATEGAGVRMEERLKCAVDALSRFGFEALAARLASLLAELGLRGEFHAVAVLPRYEPGSYARAHMSGSGSLVGRGLRLADYWAGLLAFESSSGERLFVGKQKLLHRALAAALG